MIAYRLSIVRRTALVAGLGLGCATTPYSADGGVRPEVLRHLQAVTAAARGQAVGELVPTRVVARADAPAILRAAADADEGSAEREASDEALGTLGLWPPEEHASEAAALLVTEQLLGFYLPRERTLYMMHDAKAPAGARLLSILGGRDLWDELVLSHELAHALQHRAEPSLFDRPRFFHAHSDAASATVAAAEGDATRASLLAAGTPELPPGDAFEASIREEIEADTDLAGAPAILRLELGFAYGRGYALAAKEGTAVISDPPISTEQGLHDAQRREAFTALDLRGIPAPEGCVLVHENEAGELGIRALLEDHAPEADAGAWEGWDGDRYGAYHCGETRELAWLTLWDSEADAAEFEEAYAGIALAVARRARLAEPPQARRDGREVLVATPRAIPAVSEMAARARRGRVATLDELFRFFGEPPRPTL